MESNRHNEIKSKIKAFSKEAYRNEELLGELFQFQQEIVNLTFEESHAENMNLRIYDVHQHLEAKNQELGAVSDEDIQKLKVYCKEFSSMIGREVAGNSGEKRVFKTLENLNVENIVLQNVELASENSRAEIDAVVITPKAVFLIETKNSTHDMIIDARGNYFRAHGFMDFDYNIAEKVNVKEHLLQQAIKAVESSGDIKNVKIIKLVVFANSKMHCDNRYKYLKECYLSNLPHIINEYIGPDAFSLEDMDAIASAIKGAECKEAYPVNFDFDGFKDCFADIMVSLERAAEVEKEISEEQDPEELWATVPKKLNKKSKYILGAAGAVATVTLTGIAYAKFGKAVNIKIPDLIKENARLAEENAYLKDLVVNLRIRGAEKDMHFDAVISDGLRHGSSLATSYMADKKQYLNGN